MQGYDQAEILANEAIEQAEKLKQLTALSNQEGQRRAEYDRLQQKYIAWSKKNGVETTVILAYPFISHDTPNDRNKTEFVEFLVSHDKTSAKGWQLWLGTPEGKKMG